MSETGHMRSASRSDRTGDGGAGGGGGDGRNPLINCELGLCLIFVFAAVTSENSTSAMLFFFLSPFS